MSDFNVDQYIKENTPPPQQQQDDHFDVDKYIADHTDPNSRAARAQVALQGGRELFEDGEDALKGYAHGRLLGGEGIGGGALSALIDNLQAGVHNYAPSLAGPSPSQVNEQLKSQGFKGDVGPTDEQGLYRQGYDDTENDFAASQKRSPWLYGGADLLGNIQTGMGIGNALEGPLGMAGVGKTALKTALAEGGGTGLLKELGVRALKDAAMAVPLGGLQAGLSSQHHIIGGDSDDAMGLAGDVARGAKNAGLIGGGLSLAMNAAPLVKDAVGDKLSNFIKSKEYLRLNKLAFADGKQGINLNDEAHMTQPVNGGPSLSELSMSHAADLTRKILAADKVNGQAIGDALDTATQNGVKLNLTNELNSNRNIISQMQKDNVFLNVDPKVQKIFDDISTGRGTAQVVNPTEANTLVSNLDKIIKSYKNSSSPQSQAMYEAALDMRTGIKNKMFSDVPGYKLANDQFASFRTKMPEVFTRKGVPEDLTTPDFGPIDKEDLLKSIKASLDGATKPGAGDTVMKAKQVSAGLQKNLQQMKDQAAMLRSSGATAQADAIDKSLETMGASDVDGFMNRFRDNADRSNMIYRMNRQTQSETSLGKFKDVFLGKDVSLNAANKFGLGAKRMSDIGKEVYSWGPDELRTYAQRLQTTQGSAAMGHALEDAVNSGDIGKKNAIIFSLLQNPATRSSLYHPDDKQGN